ncbi:hypothetical protein SMICM304S_05078 [Streptomyces microflavus]
MESAEIRRRWLSFFEERGHTVVPSASLIADDPTLLLVPAGMVPFKPYFLGEVKPPAPRVTSVQKCVRTPDIEEVGKTTRHGTFFQMCGNFSFGDYFKEGAIQYAWEALTNSVEDGGFGLEPEKLWITVYLDDDEAEQIWRDKIGVPAERIQRLGKKDNFWSMGVPGPCGPCSEINYDRGPEFGVEGGPAVNDERYVEIWNLVFMQYERGAGDGKEDFPILGDLPSQNIDTGLGLERLAMILQGVQNMYETDTLRVVMDKATELTGVRYGAEKGTDVSLRVVADHIRTSVMLIGDGVTPGNEGRGYVLRRIMRRAIRNMRLMGATGSVVKDLVDVVIDTMGLQYPELITDRKRIETVALAEEAAFLKALKGGTNILETAVTETKAAGGQVLAGDKAFLLHDTWGFPIDLTLEMAAEQGLSVDEDGFRRLMQEQRDKAKADARAKKTGHADLSAYREVADNSGATEFTGYTSTAGESTIVGLLVDGVPSPAATEGDEVEVVLDRTPFYAEGGGQLADTGRIRLDTGAVIEIRDVQKPVPGVHVHKGVVQVGEVTVGAPVFASIDNTRRRAIARAHSATHLTHQALRDALGPTAAQAGSENSPGRFRFDFGSPAAVPGTVLADVGRRSTRSSRANSTSRPRSCRSTRPRSRAPSPSSARSTASGSGSSPSATSPRSCAAAPRPQHRPARPGQAARRVLHRLRSAPYRGPRRRGRVQLPRPGAHGRRPAPGAGQGPPRGAPGEDRGHARQAEGRREGDREVPRGEGPPGRRRTRRVRQGRPGYARPGHRPGPRRHLRRRPAQAGPRRPRPYPGGRPGRRGPVHHGQRPPPHGHRHQRGRPRAGSQGR